MESLNTLVSQRGIRSGRARSCHFGVRHSPQEIVFQAASTDVVGGAICRWSEAGRLGHQGLEFNLCSLLPFCLLLSPLSYPCLPPAARGCVSCPNGHVAERPLCLTTPCALHPLSLGTASLVYCWASGHGEWPSVTGLGLPMATCPTGLCAPQSCLTL